MVAIQPPQLTPNLGVNPPQEPHDPPLLKDIYRAKMWQKDVDNSHTFRKPPFASEEDVAKVLVYQHKLLNAYVAAEPAPGNLVDSLPRIERLLTEIRNDVAELKADIAGLKGTVAGLKTEVAVVKLTTSGLPEQLDSGFAEIKDENTTLKAENWARTDNLERSILALSKTIKLGHS